MYPKDTEKWKQFTTIIMQVFLRAKLFCIPKILKNESNSQLAYEYSERTLCCFVSQRYWKMKAIHNLVREITYNSTVVLYPKDTEKWKQFTTGCKFTFRLVVLFCIPKILKNESNSQQYFAASKPVNSCFVSQRYWKMKAIHNMLTKKGWKKIVVLYPKDTEKWKQFTTPNVNNNQVLKLFCIPKILKNESNSQQFYHCYLSFQRCFVSQRYWKMKAIHNWYIYRTDSIIVVLYPKDTEKWKQFTTYFVAL